VRTKWSHVQITFTEADIKLTSFPHMDAMVITAHIDKWDVTRVLVDNGSQMNYYSSPFLSRWILVTNN
jgi:hypothetical protein